MDLGSLRALLARDDPKDRAFVDGMVRMAWARTADAESRRECESLLDAVRSAARAGHAALRARIASGALRGAELRRHFEEIPALDRDHYVEEVLGIAYPPLEEAALGPELVPYTPSGFAEIVHALDVTGLGPSDRLCDIGSGTGKAVMLAALLCGSTSAGVECDRSLNALARAAAAEVGLDVRFEDGDAREVDLGATDVVFMYIPFTGASLATFIDRLRRRPPRFLCAGALDLERYGELVEVGTAVSWLHVYAWRR